MPSNITSTVPLREVIYMYSDAARLDDTKFRRLWVLAFRGFVQMGLNSFWQVKTVSLPVNENNTVSYPTDYINWVKVGIDSNGNGDLRTLRVNNQLSTSNAMYAGAAGLASTNLYINGEVPVGRSSGLIHAGEFKEDKDNKCFLLSPGTTLTEVVLMYLSAPGKDEEYAIPIQFQEAMISWISWQDVQHIPASSHFGRGDKQDRSLAFRAALKLAKRAYRPFRLSEAEQIYAESQFLGIK